MPGRAGERRQLPADARPVHRHRRRRARATSHSRHQARRKHSAGTSASRRLPTDRHCLPIHSNPSAWRAAICAATSAPCQRAQRVFERKLRPARRSSREPCARRRPDASVISIRKQSKHSVRGPHGCGVVAGFAKAIAGLARPAARAQRRLPLGRSVRWLDARPRFRPAIQRQLTLVSSQCLGPCFRLLRCQLPTSNFQLPTCCVYLGLAFGSWELTLSREYREAVTD